PGAKPVGVGVLRGWRFLINLRGVATIVADETSSVHGVVWELTDEHLRSLDGYEGVPNLYRRKIVSVELAERGEVSCTIYIDESEGGDEPGPPRAGYLEKILQGAASFHLPRVYVEFLHSFSSTSPANGSETPT
ncbi:MAG: hypothetical protein A2Y63_03180, partial [Candidatus Riflebacteria bacterium RBG_13_59_9]